MPSFLILRHHHDWLAIYVFKTRVKVRAKAEREGGVNGVMGHGSWAMGQNVGTCLLGSNQGIGQDMKLFVT